MFVFKNKIKTHTRKQTQNHCGHLALNPWMAKEVWEYLDKFERKGNFSMWEGKGRRQAN